MKPDALQLVIRHHRRARWMRPLWIAVAGLALMFALRSFGFVRDRPLEALGGVAVVALCARLWPRRTLPSTARELDARRGLKNRLEALVEMGERRDPLAAAVNAEAQAFLERHPLPLGYGWFSGLVLFSALLVANGAHWLRQPVPATLAPVPAVAIATPPVVEIPAPLIEDPPPSVFPAPPAWLRWIAPEAESFAGPKEELPLAAETESSTGLRNLKLHVALNGEIRPPMPIPQDIPSGVNPVSLALELESLEAQPYDVVTYFLEAERVRPVEAPPEPVWPPVFSALQLVHVRTAREEPLDGFAPEDAARAVLQQIVELRREQFAVLRDAFALGHELPARNEPQWPELLRTLEERQRTTGERVVAAKPSIAAASIPLEAAERLTEADAEMQKAAAELARAEPAAAVKPATQALVRLVAAEKIVARVVRENHERFLAALAAQAAETPDAAELPAREITPAGRLERLLAEQKTLADQFASRDAPAGIFQEQDRVARAIGRLAAEAPFPKNVNALVESAASAATEAAIQANEQDHVAATEPATRAAQLLAEAVAALEAAGREQAVADLLAAQRMLNAAATDLLLAPREEFAATAENAATRAAAAQQALQAAARRQQQQGSAEAARRLDELARAIAQADLARELAARPAPAQADASRKLYELAERAAAAANRLGDEEQLRREALAVLQRAQADLDRIAGRQRPQGERPPAIGVKELHAAQRQLVERMTALERATPEPRDQSKEALRALEVDQRATENDAAVLAAYMANSGNGSRAALLTSAKQEMHRAATELERTNLSAALPPANRALAVLARLLEEEARSQASDGSRGGRASGGAGGAGAGASGGAAAAAGGSAGGASGGGAAAGAGASGGASGGAGGSGTGRAGSSGSSTEIYGQVVGAAQRIASPGGIPPPPGDDGTIADVRLYADVLSDRVAALIQLSFEAQRETKRPQMLTTANPADAPPDYRPAVADYFEKLARERLAPAKP